MHPGIIFSRMLVLARVWGFGWTNNRVLGWVLGCPAGARTPALPGRLGIGMVDLEAPIASWPDTLKLPASRDGQGLMADQGSGLMADQGSGLMADQGSGLDRYQGPNRPTRGILARLENMG